MSLDTGIKAVSYSSVILPLLVIWVYPQFGTRLKLLVVVAGQICALVPSLWTCSQSTDSEEGFFLFEWKNRLHAGLFNLMYLLLTYCPVSRPPVHSLLCRLCRLLCRYPQYLQRAADILPRTYGWVVPENPPNMPQPSVGWAWLPGSATFLLLKKPIGLFHPVKLVLVWLPSGCDFICLLFFLPEQRKLLSLVAGVNFAHVLSFSHDSSSGILISPGLALLLFPLCATEIVDTMMDPKIIYLPSKKTLYSRVLYIEYFLLKNSVFLFLFF